MSEPEKSVGEGPIDSPLEPAVPAPAPAAPAPPPSPTGGPGGPRGPGERFRKPFRPKQDRGPRSPEPAPPLEDLSSRGPNLRDLNSQIQDELDAALAGFSGDSLLAAGPASAPTSAPSVPGRKKGRVIKIRGDDVFVDLPGGRSQGMLSLQQFDGVAPAIGSEVEVDIDRYDAANGLLILNRLGAVQHVDWSSVAVGMIVEAKVTATNKGGLSVEVNGIRGFLPVSQLDLYRVEQPEQFVNQKLRCVVTEVNPTEKNLVVSRRSLLERERDEQREKFWTGLEVGQVRRGTVRSIREFGAFVDLGGADGLIPISELSWERVNAPSDVVKEGQVVDVKVVRLDPVARKIGLSLKQMGASPWDEIGAKVIVGSTIKGKVSRLAEFGAFVEILPGLEGLVHISELAPFRVRKASAVVQVGQEVDVRVLGIDKDQRRIALSIKAVSAAAEVETEEPEAAEEAPPVEVKPRVRNFTLRGGVGRNPLENKG